MTIAIMNACRQFLRASSIVRQQKATNFIILLPQMPECSSQNNELIRMVESGDLPAYDGKLSFEESQEGLAKLALEYEMHFHDLCKQIENPNQPKTFASVVEPLCTRHAELDYAWGTVKHLFTTTHYDTPQQTIQAKIKMKGLKKLVSRSLLSQCTNGSFYRAIREVASDPQILTDWQSYLCERYLVQAEMSGVTLDEKKTKLLLDIRRQSTHHMNKYWINIEKTGGPNPNKIGSLSPIQDAPHSSLYEWALNPQDYLQGPYFISKSDASYMTFMQFCCDRGSRLRYYIFWNYRAGFGEKNLQDNNSVLIEEIRYLRNDEAKAFGYKSYSEMMIVPKMAKSLDEVEGLLVGISEKAKKKFQSRLADMQLYARKHEMLTEQLKPWDYYFYARKLIESATRFNPNDFASCLPFEKTWKNLLSLTENIFGIKYVDVTEKVPVWHPSVRVLSVLDAKTGESKGLIYVDSVARPGKVQTNFVSHGRSSDQSCNYKPIAYVSFNAMKLDETQLLPMSLQMLIFLAKSLGDALSVVLSESPYSMMSSTSSMEDDCERLHSRVMKWLVLEPSVLSRLSDGQLSVSDADIAREVYIESALPVLFRDTFLSEFDVAVHCSPKIFWLDIYGDLHKRYYDKKLDKEDNFPCSFSQIFFDNGATYYSKLWSEMVACDVVAAFKEAGATQNDEAMVKVGQHLRSTLFASCGRQSTRKLFEKFRGRDVQFDHLHDFYKLNN